MNSQRVRAADFRSRWLIDRAKELGQPARVHRKVWEFAVIVQEYLERALVETIARPGENAMALGFGVGREPIAAWLAARGCAVTATDHPAPTEAWTGTGQHAATLDDLPWRGICDEDTFRALVSYEPVDMRAIPEGFAGQFDFVWSAGSLEHLGGLDAGAEFVAKSMRCLRPGGVAVHTTEYNPIPGATLNAVDLALYRRRDLEHLVARLELQGDRVRPLDLAPGDDPEDIHIDAPPYQDAPHLSLWIGHFVTTSVVLVCERGEGGA